MADKKVRMAPELEEHAPPQDTDPSGRDIPAEQAARANDLDQQQKRQAAQSRRDAVANMEAHDAAKEAATATKTAEREIRAEYLQTPLTAAEGRELERLEKLAMGNQNVEPETMYRLSDLRIRSKVGAPTPAA